jgi:hypothetical protein
MRPALSYVVRLKQTPIIFLMPDLCMRNAADAAIRSERGEIQWYRVSVFTASIAFLTRKSNLHTDNDIEADFLKV